MEKPKFEIGELVWDPLDRFAFWGWEAPPHPYEVLGIQTHSCPCGCKHRWFEYTLSNGQTRGERLLEKYVCKSE